MNIGLTAGFGTLIGADVLATLKAHGWTIMRIGKQVAQPTPLPLLIAEVQTAGLEALVYCDSTQVGDLTPGILGAEVTHPIAFARGTEPVGLPLRTGASSYDLPLDAAAFAATVNATVPMLKAKGIPAWTCMTSLDQSTLAWTAVVLETLDPYFGISVHRYPPGGAEEVSASTEGGRELEFAHFKAVIGSRPFMVGECGWNQGPYQHWWEVLLSFGTQRVHRHLTDARVSELIVGECRYWLDHGAQFTCIYQITDGPDRCHAHPQYANTAIEGFGLMHQPGAVWKPSLDVPAGVR